MNIKPLRDRLWVKKDTPEEKTAGGIVLPEVVKDKPMTGEVLAVGPGACSPHGELIPMEIKVGDRVLFKRYDGTNAIIQGQEVFVIPAREVLAIIETVEEPKRTCATDEYNARLIEEAKKAEAGGWASQEEIDELKKRLGVDDGSVH